MSDCAAPDENDFKGDFYIESYGVKVRVASNDRRLLEDARRTARLALAGQVRFTEKTDTERGFTFCLERDADEELVFTQGEEEIPWGTDHYGFLKFFNSRLRLTVGEHAKERVFIHAGVVAKNGKALVLPADSYNGKTTLVGELVKTGAEYYSDEYAVFDSEGLVHPFPRLLSYRRTNDDRFREEQVTVASLGGTIGQGAIPVGAVVLTKYEAGAKWHPEVVETKGQAVMECVPHTVPLRANPGFSLAVISKALENAVVVKSPRGEAAEFAKIILSFFDDVVG